MQINRDFTAELTDLNARFKTDFAIISQIDGNSYRVCQLASELDAINIDDKFVTKDTYFHHRRPPVTVIHTSFGCIFQRKKQTTYENM